jgi:predicted dehydrogenase
VVFSVFQYPGGIPAQIHASWLNPQKVREIIVVGREKMLIWNDLSKHPVSIFHKGAGAGDQVTHSFASHSRVAHSAGVEHPEIPSGEPLKNACRHFIDCLSTGEPCLTGAAEAAKIVRCLEVAEQALKRRDHLLSIEEGKLPE